MVDITGTLQYQLNEIREKKFTLALLLLRSVPNTPYAYCCYYDDEDVDYMIEGIQLPEDRKASIWESETEAEQMFPATCQFAKQLNDNLLRAHTLSCATNSSEFKTYVVEWLETQSQSLFDGSEIASYGSVKSGLGNTQSSDVDLTILVAHELARQKHDVLQKLKEHFTKCSSILTHVEVVKCKFPILRMTFESNGQSVMIDMGVNNFKAIMNSQMLSAYAKIDQRLPILALAIKQWAKVNGLYGAATFGFNSFSLVLLLVHYFQSGLRSPILPILDAFNYDTSIGLRENLMKMEESHSSVKFVSYRFKILLPSYHVEQRVNQAYYRLTNQRSISYSISNKMSNCFDEKDSKYRVLFKKLHIRMAARIVCGVLIGFVALDLIQSFRQTTAMMMYSWLSACFALGIYGSLTYGVFKEKRIFTLPFLCVLVGFLSLVLFIFTMAALFSPSGLKKFAIELGGVDEKAKPEEQAQRWVIFFFIMMSLVDALQAWFLEIIYRFFHYLKDRETSFTFNLDTEFQMTD
ncbi:hypothetical protein M3Y94_00190900 [Aphelenchoides besseyi]|nr:hypothetical protein M3Y94_00190900 [Aphelenchoides besseyi]